MTHGPLPPHPPPGDGPRNGLEPEPRLERWICSGKQRDGRDCNNVLLEAKLARGSKLRIRCDKCGTWNIRDAV